MKKKNKSLSLNLPTHKTFFIQPPFTMKFFFLFTCTTILFSHVAYTQNKKPQWFINAVQNAQQHYEQMIKEAEQTPLLFPRTVEIKNATFSLLSTQAEDWTSGFFPGNLWYLFELTNKKEWKEKAAMWTNKLDTIQYFHGHHDVGFMIYCSYGNGFRLIPNAYYKNVIINGAKSLIKRYRPNVGAIQSWNLQGWQGKKGWQCPVIIDNMMNLELLCKASQLTKNDTFLKVAINHANKTLEHHYRKDFSCYHVIDYDSITGLPKHKITAQGFADESDWARGQAWGLYGYTFMYRETKQKQYLDRAKDIFRFLSHHPNMPTDKILYWDLKANTIGLGQTTPRDASAAAIVASALLELGQYGTKEEKKMCLSYAEEILKTLSSPSYTAAIGTNNNFILKHSVGSIPHQQEIDMPLIYADYYYLEALSKYQKIKKYTVQ